MQNRSNRGSGKPVWVTVQQQPALMIGTRPKRIALGPAAQHAASTGRTHDSTRPVCTSSQIHLAKTEPSTHDPKRTFQSYPLEPPSLVAAAVDVAAKATVNPNWDSPVFEINLKDCRATLP